MAGKLTQDACGYLAEARGEEHTSPEKALALYLVQEGTVQEQAESEGIALTVEDYVKLPKQLKRRWARQFGKNPSGEASLYGKFISHSYSTAGLHVHFSNERDVTTGNGYSMTVPQLIDIPRFVFGLDKIFAKEIKDAKRVPGLYEMKPYGFEYRSLPTSIELSKVVEALDYLQDNRWSSEFAWK